MDMRGTDTLPAVLGRHRRKALLGLVLALALAIPIGAVLFPAVGDEGPSPETSPDDAAEASRLPGAPAPDLDLVRSALDDAAEAREVSYEPARVPEPAPRDPLVQAVETWLSVQHGDVPEDTRREARAQAERVPDDLREPLARLLLAHAEATRLQREALEPLTEDQRERLAATAADPAARDALLRDPPSWALEASREVRLDRSFQAARLLVDAADESVPAIREHAGHGLRAPAEAAPRDDPAAEAPTPALVEALAGVDRARELAGLEELLAALGGPSPGIQPPPAPPLTDQLRALDDGDRPATGDLPTNLDRRLGELWLSSAASTELLAAHGPSALLEAQMLRVRAMEQAAPTLEAWRLALEDAPVDTRQVARPSLAAGRALDRSADVPGPEADVADRLAFGLSRPAPDGRVGTETDPVPALARLYEAADADPPPDWRSSARASLAPLDEDEREGLATLTAGLARAYDEAEAAAEDLSRDELDRLLETWPDLRALRAGEQLDDAQLARAREAARLAQSVDAERLEAASLTAAASVDRALPLLSSPATAQQSTPDPAPDADVPAECDPEAPSSNCDRGILFEDPLELVVVGAAGDTRYTRSTEVAPVLSLDLGGDDTYERPVARATPFRPVSVGLDVGGEDVYTPDARGQGQGLVGVGLLVQTGGDTTYRVAQRGQGYGGPAGGIGALVDEAGDDTYRAQAQSQAATDALESGAGILVDAAGDDRYTSSRGVGFSLGAAFLDLGGRDRYDLDPSAHGARLDQGVDLDDVPDRVYTQRRDNALWLDGTSSLDLGFALDVETEQLDRDDDRFPSLLEALADSHAGRGSRTPVDTAAGAAEAANDTDGDGAPNAVEETAGTDPDNGTQAPVSPPQRAPMAPDQARQVYRQLRGHYTDAPPPNGLLLDVRVPLDDRTGVECPEDDLQVCLTASGPGEEAAQGHAAVDVRQVQFVPIGPGGLMAGIDFQREIDAETRAEFGLVAVGAPTSSTFELPYLLSVDLGGPDTYEEGAGGAIPVANDREGPGSLQVSPEQEDRTLIPTTHLDVGGADTYHGDGLAHGAGGGLLVDLGGDGDRYLGGDLTQGALGGLLFDEAGDDRYEADRASQGSALPNVGFSTPVTTDSSAYEPLEQAIRVAHEGAQASTATPSLLVDGAGDDVREAGPISQGYAGMTPGNATASRTGTALVPQRVTANETQLVAGIVDVAGDDVYRAGQRSQAVTAPDGLALLVDRRGDDDYRAGGLVTQAGVDTRTLADAPRNTTRGPGLALLADALGADTYEVHPAETDNRSRTDEREGNLTRTRVPLGSGARETTVGGVRLTALEAAHADLEASTRDGDGDGWATVLEDVLGTDGDDPESRPAPGDPDAAARGRLIDLPQAGLVVGGAEDDAYRRDAVLAIDVGGANTYANNAGGPILDPLAREADPQVLGVEADDATRDPVLFQHPVTAVLDAGSEGSTFEAPRGLSQGASLFTVGLALTSGGDNAFHAPGVPRPVASVDEGPRASLDGLLGPKEYAFEDELTWEPEVEPVRERAGQLGLAHDGHRLYLGGRLLDADPGEDRPFPEVEIHLAALNHTPARIDRLRVTPEDGGTVDDEFWDHRNATWRPDGIDDANRTRARMDYAGGGWTFEVARPIDEPVPLELEVDEPSGPGATRLVLDLCQTARVVDRGPFTETRIREDGRRIVLADPLETGPGDDDELHELEEGDNVTVELKPDGGRLAYESWHWANDQGTAGGQAAGEDCRLFDTEDVGLAPGEPALAFLEFEDPTTGETWRYPPEGAARDGNRTFPTDGTLDDELRGWLPVFPAAPEETPPELARGPRLTQGASLGGVGLLTAVSTGVGNDTYTAFRQGQGYGIARGTGILAELGGPDTYDLDRRGQGQAREDGIGLLLDHRGNDRYEARALAQGHSPQAVASATGALDLAPHGEALARVQPRGTLVDLGGYDHYDYGTPEDRHELLSLPVPVDSAYQTHAGNDRVWRGGEGGFGVDTAMASHGPRAIVGDSLLADVDAEAWPAVDGECPSRAPPPSQARFRPHHEHGVRLANGTVCLALTIEDPYVNQVPLRRVEVLRNGQREVVREVRGGADDIATWPLGSETTRIVLPLNTTSIPDGPASWRVVAFYDAPRPEEPAPSVAFGPVPPVTAEAQASLTVSNPPAVKEFDVRQDVISPEPAVGDPGLQFDVRVTRDLSEDALELAGYGKTRANVECPFDEDRTCNRYTLYLDDEGRLRSHRPDDVVPQTRRENPGDAEAANTYVHRMRAPLRLVGGETVGVVDEEDPDVGLDLDGPTPLTDVVVGSGDDGGGVYATDGVGVGAGSLRLVPADGRGPGTLVHSSDPDVAADPAPARVATSSTPWSPGDPLYVDLGSASDAHALLVTPNAGEEHEASNGTLVPADDTPDLVEARQRLQVAHWRFHDRDDSGSLTRADTVYVDADADGPGAGNVTPGDVRLGLAPASDRGAARLTYHHKPLYASNVTVHSQLATATRAGGDADRVRLVPNQTSPVVGEAYGVDDQNPVSTTGPQPAGGSDETWSRFWLPLDDTRLYPSEPGAPLEAAGNLELSVRTAFTDGGGTGSDQFEGVAFQGSRQAPSRLDLFVPARTEQRVVLNATHPALDDNLTLESRALGDDERRLSWPADDAEPGRYNLTLTAYDRVAHTAPDRDPRKRWAHLVEGPSVRVDPRPPEAEVALPDFVGTSLIDTLTDTLQVPWNVTDASEIEEIRIYGAPGNRPDDEDWRLVERVRDPDRGGAEFPVDADEDTYSFVAVAMDESGNVEGVEDNFWPTRWPDGGRCPSPLPPDVEVWPSGTGDRFPSLGDHCFQSRSTALRAAFRAGLEEKENRAHVATIDRLNPFLNDTRLELPAREGPREVRVDGRTVLGLAAGEPAIPRACASDRGPAPIAEVNFFMLGSGPNGSTVENKHQLNRTGSDGCWAFHRLAEWTRRDALYHQGFWTVGLEVVDAAGNTAERFLGTAFLDTRSPELSADAIQLPPGQLAVASGQRITVDANATDPTGVAEATLAAPAFNRSGPQPADVDDGRVSGELAVDRDVEPGVYPVYLNVTDALGNTRVVQREVPVNTTPTSLDEPPRFTDLAPDTGEGPPVSTVPGGFSLAFTTTHPSRFRVLAGPDASSLSPVHRDRSNFTTAHNVTVDDLTPGARYVVQVVAFSAGGHEARSETMTVRAGPAFAATIQQPSPGEVLGPEANVTWTLERAPEAEIDADEVSTLVSLSRRPGATFQPVGGQTTGFNATTLDLDLSGFPSGKRYGLRIEAAAADQREVTVLRPVTVDTAAPAPRLERPANGWTNDTQPAIEVRVRDALAGVPADPVASARLDGEPVPTAAEANGTRVLVQPARPLEPGNHRLSLAVEDRVGNEARRTFAIHVDREAPTLRVTSVPEGPHRPGDEIPVEVFAWDEGRVDRVRARLGSAAATAPTPGGLDELTVPVPEAIGERANLTVEARDRAGNRRVLEHPVALDDAAPGLREVNATAGVAEARVTVRADEPVRVVASTGSTLRVAGVNETVRLRLPGLEPDRRHALELRIADRAGNALTRTLAVETEPDRGPPSAPEPVAVAPLPNGTMAVEWAPADDDAGIRYYRVLRVVDEGSGWASLGHTDDRRLLDGDIEPGTAYRYRVQAVDVVGKESPSATSPPATALARPSLADANVTKASDAGGRYEFEVTYRHESGVEADRVALVLDGSPVAMHRVDGDPADGATYRTTVQLDPHTLSGSHAYRFQAQAGDGAATVRLPEHGNFTGPLVSTLDDRGAPNPIPAPAGLAALALLAAALSAPVGPSRPRP